jgi:hypothetical protein
MLVHMSPREVESLQTLAKANGGTLTINPQTGLPEAGFLDSLLPMIAGFALGPAGFGLMSAFGAAATVGGITALATHDLGKGLMAGFGAWGGAGLGEGLLGAGTDAMTTAGMANYGDTLAAQGLEAGTPAYGEAASKLGLESQAAAQAASNASKLGAGFDAVTSSPSALGNFAMNNGKSLLAATSPMLAGTGVQTTTSAPQTPSTYRPFMYDPHTQGLTALAPVSGKGVKEGGLMSLANGGAVAFADGGGFVAGGGFDRPGDYEKMVAYKAAQDAKDKAALDSWTVSETSPMYAGYMAATDQRKNDIKSMDMENTKLAAYRQTMADMYPNSTIVSGGTLGYDPTGDQTDNYITDASGKSRYLTNQDLVARDAYTKQLLTTQGNYAAPGAPDVPAAGGTPTESASATGIQSLAKPDTPATTTPAPTGIQTIHGSIYDPVTGHFRNPTEAEIGAKGIKEARDNINTVGEMTALTKQYFDSYKPGEVLDFADGTLTKNADGTATHKYTDANGKTQSYTFSAGTDIATIAKSDPSIAKEWKSMFNYTAPTGTGVTTPPGTGSPIITTPGPTYPSVPTPGSGGPGKSTTRVFDWQNTPIDRLPTVAQKKPEEAMSGESLTGFNALSGKGSTATKAWTTYPGRDYLPSSSQGFYVQHGEEASSSNPTKPTTTPVTSYTDPKKPPTESAGEGYYWDWNGTKWVAVQYGPGIARGGMIGYATGGLGSLGGYSDGGQLLRGGGDGVSDSIPASIGGRQPARLADGEFVVPARIVSELGNGSTEAGARRLYQMMDRVQHARKKSVGKGNVAKNTRAEQYLPA